MNVCFYCPGCERPGCASLPQREPWRCPTCGRALNLPEPAATSSAESLTLHACAACGNHELYKQKNFPHWLGVGILAAACLGFIVLNALRLQWWAWGVLLASAAIDGGLYLLVKDAVVCYRCGARHSGINRSGNAPFDLSIQERYRQERLLTEAERKPAP